MSSFTMLDGGAEIHDQDGILVVKAPRPPKLTVKEALAVILANSQLEALRNDPHPEASNRWAGAVIHDLAMLREFLDMIVFDLQRITGVRLKYDRTLLLPSTDQAFATNDDRVRTLASEFHHLVTNHYGQILDLQAVTRNTNGAIDSDWFIPIDKVVLSNPRDTATFHHVSMDRRRLHRIKFANANLKPLDDFTRNIPNHVLDHVGRLQNLTFDWKPRVLDGIIVSDQMVSQRNLGSATINAVNKLREMMPDPALVITPDGEELLAINFWKEGADAMTPFQVWREKNNNLFHFIIYYVCLILGLIGTAVSLYYMFTRQIDNTASVFAFTGCIVTAFCFGAVIIHNHTYDREYPL